MSKLETVIYIVGPKRSWEFQAKHVKRIFLFVFLIFLGLGGTILFQQYNHLQELAKSDEKFDQETLKNEKLLALLAKIKEQGMYDNSNGTITDIDMLKQQKLNEQQSILIEQQRKELEELKGVLKQRETVVQQFQLEKQSTKDQIINLQEKLRRSNEELQQTDSEKKSSIERLNEIQIELVEAKKFLAEKGNNLIQAQKDIISKEKIIKVNKYVIGTTNMKIKKRGNKLDVIFRINNLTEDRQTGRVGVYPISMGDSLKPVPYASGKTNSYSINRFKNISNVVKGYQKGQQIRVVVWNQNREVLLDEIFSGPN